MYYLCRKISFIMTINEKKQLTIYIKGLVRESLGEMDSMPDWYNDVYGTPGLDDEEEGFENDETDDEGWNTHNDFWNEMGHENGRHYEGPDVTSNDDPIYNDEEEEIAGLNELRKLTESMARDAIANILMEKKGGKGWKNQKKDGKRKNKKEKTSSRDKANIDFLKSDGINAAAYAYKLYGAKTEKEKASARSKLYKKRDGKKNDTGVPYKFNSKEAARLINLSKNKDL